MLCGAMRRQNNAFCAAPSSSFSSDRAPLFLTWLCPLFATRMPHTACRIPHFGRRVFRFCAILLFLPTASCTGLFSNVFGQDDPALFVQVPPLYRLPLPKSRQHFLLVQGIGGRFSHSGDQTWAFDWSMAMHTPVPAARAGVVVEVRAEPEDRALPLTLRHANFVRIRHEDGTVGVYAHIDSSVIRPGAKVRPGDIIASSGNTGYSTQPHLHFHVEKNNRSIPIAFLDVKDPDGIPRVGKLYTGSW